VERSLTVRPIGVIHTPYPDRVSAPRQTYVTPDAEGTIVLESGHQYEHALEDLEGWDYLWVLYWFHLNDGWRPKVLPPRSKVRRGVFATRSPHRPSPIGMSVVKLVRVEGLTVHVRGVDMIDGTPVLDIKPYVPSADALPDRWLR
jgi:tRNA-Thr(GGU) m(6)t(6)A37 methyltransferase TsaA